MSALTAFFFSALLSLFDSSSVVIASEESKNSEMKEVFNEIRWIQKDDTDIWMMNQSHAGRFPNQPWDRIAIVIDKTTSPVTARFYQFPSGPLEWEESLIKKRVDYRASCFACHNNGPRAIRASSANSEAPLSWQDRVKIQIWNLRIKTYGRIQFAQDMDILPKGHTTPFRVFDAKMNDVLKVKTCTYCHKEQGLLARGVLRRQQRGTIEHLVKSGEMPPAGFSLSENEIQELQDFVRGFN